MSTYTDTNDQDVSSPPVWTIGERLEKARTHARIDRDEMADRLGVSERTIRNYENEAVRITRSVIIAYSVETLVPVDWLIEGATSRSRCFLDAEQLSFQLAA